MRKTLCLVLLAVLSLLSDAVAQKPVNIAGLGMGSCGTWTEARRLNKSEGFEQWTLGFLTGVAAGAGGKFNPLNGIDAHGAIAWIDNYCSSHPLEPISDAAQHFILAHPR